MDNAMTDGGVAELYVEHFDSEEVEQENAEESDWEADNEANNEAQEQEQDDGVVDIRIGETYSKHKGSKVPLVHVQEVDSEFVSALLCDAPSVETIEDDMENLIISPRREGFSTPKSSEKDTHNSTDVTPTKDELDAHLESFRQFYGYSQEDKRKRAKRSLIPAVPHPSIQPKPKLAAASKAKRKHPGPKPSSQPEVAPSSKRAKNETSEMEQVEPENTEDESDIEYVPPEECSSGEDSEVEQVRKIARDKEPEEG
ncbi:uncharacterized protein LOC112271927 [Brachypodium distachyon]|uniref:uncharacterized protein LOC112271927 n=1 Tax=Brachypodium distachyon TaxID=15368 RepID=UPI000D0CDF15|nr:uncharacterized protein LOC112271927 [Brachypodium distachyon]|eukprot:XP_024317956.1 uncharacterized protein LOC112271927 [Brachypodium distachyon]